MRQFSSTLEVFIFLVFLSSTIPILIGCWRFRRLNEVTQSVWVLAFLSFGFDVLQRVLWWNKIPNLFVAHVYTLVEFWVIAYIFRVEFKNFLKKNLIDLLILLFTVFSLINFFFIQGYLSNNSYQKIVECLILILCPLLYFYKLSQELTVISLTKEPMFWFSVGTLLYFSGGVFIFIFSNYLDTNSSKELRVLIWAIHAFFLILFHLFNSMALWYSPRKQNLHGF